MKFLRIPALWDPFSRQARLRILWLLAIAACCLLLAQEFPASAQEGRINSTPIELSIRVMGSKNEGNLSQVKVELIVFPDSVAATAFSDSTGFAHFGQVEPQRYLIRASMQGYNTTELEIDPVVGMRIGNYTVHLVASSEASNVPGSPTVSARQLSIPAGAEKEFNAGLKELQQNKNPQSSIPHFTKAIEKFPGYYEAYFMLGVAQGQLKASTEAESAFRKAIDLNPKYLDAYQALAWLLYVQKKYADEVPLLEAAQKQDPQNWKWFYELSRAYANQGQWDKAMDYGKKAEAATDAPSMVHLLMFDLYNNTNQPAQALGELEQFAKLDPQSPQIEKVKQIMEDLKKQMGETGAPAKPN